MCAPGGRILDAGCGPGRDALAFAERGYELIAFDASTAMVRVARERVGSRIVVHLMRFEDLNGQSEFDGIWACASLLHVPLTSSLPQLRAWHRHCDPKAHGICRLSWVVVSGWLKDVCSWIIPRKRCETA
jgi:2-polyprenyl-3-methyl-5-hydroxy-6-metoxy-1,4-benzoquinol methylase